MGSRPADLVATRLGLAPTVSGGQVCTKCGEDKPMDAFAMRSDGRRLQSWCRECLNRWRREVRAS